MWKSPAGGNGEDRVVAVRISRSLSARNRSTGASGKSALLLACFVAVVGLGACSEAGNPAHITDAASYSMGSVSPSNPKVAVGQTVRLSVVVGGPGAVRWSSRDTTIASVDRTGTVTGEGDGETTIVARWRNHSTTTRVTVMGGSIQGSPSEKDEAGTGDEDRDAEEVIQPVPGDDQQDGEKPTSGNHFPNQPHGFTKLVERHFESTTEQGWSSAGRFSIVSSPLGLISPRSTGQMRFDRNMSPGGAAGSTRRHFEPKRAVYMAYSLRISDNYVGSPQGVSKIFYLANRLGETCGQKSSFFTALTGNGENGFPLTLFSQDTEVEPGRRLGSNVGSVRIQRGRWYRIEHVVKANTPGARDGEVHTWIDGVKTIEYRDIGWVRANSRCKGAGEWLMAEWVPVWGRRGNADDAKLLEKAGPFYQWIDHLHVSGGSR
jgi:hypothetical protein